MFINLENQVALVTGASRGIGQSIALSLGKQKAYVIGTATTEDGAQKISTFLKEQNILGKGIKLDVNNNDYNNDVRQKLADDTAFGFLPNFASM